MKQAKYRRWLGAIQVQIQNTAFYDSFLSMAMLATTMWYTAGYPLTSKYIPWYTIEMFFATLLTYKLIAMYVDYRFMYSSRIGFTAEQSYRKFNPSVADLIQIKEDVKKIKKALGIVEEE